MLQILISMPIGLFSWMRTIFGDYRYRTDQFSYSPTHCFRVLSCMNLTFLLPRSAYIVSMLSRIYFHEDSFLTGAVPYYQKPIALFRRFKLWNWNSLIFSAITLIVSVTAPRRVPRTGKMPLLIPLDSPLSWVSNRIDILQIR